MADRLLLDICACLWLMQGDRMSADSLQAISAAQASRSGICVSAITGWEVATLMRRGRYRLQVSPQTWFDRVLRLPGMRLAEITPEILIDATELPGARRHRIRPIGSLPPRRGITAWFWSVAIRS